MPHVATDHHGNTSEILWGEIAPCEHLVQIYEDEAVFLDCLQAFVIGGLRAGDGVVVVATPEHLLSLETRLLAAAVELELASLQDKYIPLDAARTLQKFMIRGWPDDILFEQVVGDLLRRAGKDGRRVRAFGEMVALLWSDGQTGATIRIEHLWHRLCHEKGFSLFCAYPRIGFTQNADMSIKQICATHSKVVRG
jgi:MEDS: MEthanogen/methylotroph, DcmR Sensory domain